ncbi:tyrosine-protein kinase receptor UFO-like isoform X2 [Oscarella lobularis]|uniref:tyrosine-protein kinase receptor UFO-like isoform X2 n=1 Tax=Oscarella lobularis TaxID=121494 RepID=UPI0033133DE1
MATPFSAIASVVVLLVVGSPLGSYNATTRPYQLPRPSTQSVTTTKSGRCEMFNSQNATNVCNPYRANRTIFVDARPGYGQERIAQFMSAFSEQLQRLVEQSSSPRQCTSLLFKGICTYLMPDCMRSSSGEVVMPRLCKESCERVFLSRHRCHQLFVAASGSSVILAHIQNFDAIHTDYRDFECYDLPSARHNETCYDELSEFPTFSSLQGATVGARTGIIVAVVVCVIALVTVIALYLARKFARRRSRVQVSSKRDDHGPAVIKRDSFTMVRTPRHSMEDIVDADIAERIGDLAVCPSRLFIEKEVGEGSFGKVYMCQLDGTTTVAAKSSKSEVGEFISEALRMRDLSHPNVMKLIGICWSSNPDHERYYSPLVLLPYMALQDLRTYLRRQRLTSSACSLVENETPRDTICQATSALTLLQYGYQIAKGMEYLSGKGILHRDLAARNCMVDWDLTIKVADFGLARVLDEEKNCYRATKGGKARLPIRWVALEGLVDGVFTTKSDVWSYGITLWEVMTKGRMPYPGVPVSNVIQFIEEGNRLGKPVNCPDEIYAIMSNCWLEQPESRPSFECLVNDVVFIARDEILQAIKQRRMQEKQSFLQRLQSVSTSVRTPECSPQPPGNRYQQHRIDSNPDVHR